MSLPDDPEELHLIAEYRTACRALRKMGWGGIVFGIINIGIGTAFTFTLGPINAVLVFIGLAVLASGIWCLVAPGAEGVIANGIALILVGLWNIVVTILNVVVGAGTQVWWGIFGIFMIVAAVKSFQKYARFSAALRHGATKEETATMNNLVKTILKAKAKEDENIVGFQVTTFGQQKAWRGRLARGVAFFIDKLSKEVLVARKQDVTIEPHGKVLLGSSLKAKVKVRDHHWDALISPQSFDRYREWKFDEGEAGDYRQDLAGWGEAAPETGIQAEDDRESERSTGIKRRQPSSDDEE